MDDFHREGVSHEAKFFIGRAKLNPYFLIAHAKSLVEIIFEKYTQHYLTKWRGRHRGTKSQPSWLKLSKKCCTPSPLAVNRLPLYPNTVCERSVPENTHLYHIEADPENYLAQYRWGHLIDMDLRGDNLQFPDEIQRFIELPLVKNDMAWETYSTCERIANSLTWLARLPTDARAAAIPANYSDFLHGSLQWVLKHLEYYRGRTGNHILNNARAIIMAGVVLEQQDAVLAGLQILKRMLPVLIQPAGALRERSSHYQLLVLTWLLDAYTFCQSGGYTDLDFLKDTIDRMRQTASLMCNAKGYLQVYIGDVSPDLSPQKTVQRLLTCYPQWWPITAFATPKIQQDDWYQLQNSQNKLVLNCPQGRYPKRFSSHGHNDMTSFVWLYKDIPILIDCGRARYTKDAVSTQQKSARGHNVAFVNGFAPLCESLVVNGHWWPTPYAQATMTMPASSAHKLILTHNGYQRATPVKTHQRVITLIDDQVRIVDQFQGKGQVRIDILWQLPPEADLANQSICLPNLTVAIDCSQTLIAPTWHFSPASSQTNHYSTAYGHAQANPVLRLSWEVTLPFSADICFKVQPCAV